MSVNVKQLFNSVGINLNDAQMDAVQSLLTEGGGDIDITEINETNLQDAIKATSNIVGKIGYDADTEEIDYNSTYLLLYAKINNSLIELPTEFLNDFLKAGVPIVLIKDMYAHDAVYD